jgi:hypothetical protein
MSNAIDRRKFLLGAGGALLALPMLESLAPRRAFAQAAAPPKRLVVFMHPHGRVVGGQGTAGNIPDMWSPGSTSGTLPATPSAHLAALAPIRSEIVTIDGIDNVVRHATSGSNAGDGHYMPERTCLTCQPTKADGSGGGPSIDYVAGSRLRANAAMPVSVVIPADNDIADWMYTSNAFWGAGGTPPTILSVDPINVINSLFANVAPPMSGPPPTPTLSDRLRQRRGSILDAVLGSFTSLRARVSKVDQARLDQHATFIRNLETAAATTSMAQPTSGCAPPNPATLPNYKAGDQSRCRQDAITCPIMIEALAQAFACDVVRSTGFHFYNNYDPIFPSMFSGTSPFDTANNWHGAIHNTPQVTDTEASDLNTAFQFFGKTFTQLVQRLASLTDTDGSRILDNTLVVWVSDLGYGAVHGCYNMPVVLAGMKSAFPKGQGRHVVMSKRASLGDLYAQVLRMLGGTDTTFGATGTLGSLSGQTTTDALMPDYGYPGYISPSTPLHSGPIDL